VALAVGLSPAEAQKDSGRPFQGRDPEELRDMFEERTALITIQETSWSGWDGNGYPIMTSAKLRVTKGSALTPETLGKKKSDYAAVEFLFYEVLVERIVEGWVDFAYRDLVIENPDGTVNLSAAQTGRFILRRGESMKLDTPTMDMGTGVTVTLNEIH
jgi:hypothetical protein